MNSSDNNLFVGKVSIMLEEINSTNAYAKEMLSKNKPSEGTAIIAHYQTSGKGQFGKTWESEKGQNLLFSVILYPTFLQAKKSYLLNQAVSLGLKDFVESLNIKVEIKWPNDIYHYDKKIAGLLIENGVIGEFLDYSIVGIGLNVNQTKFSSEIPNPTSLKLISGTEFKKEQLNGVFKFIEKRYLQLRSGHFEKIKEGYAKSLYRLSKRNIYRAGSEEFEGVIQGVNEYGQLVVETNGSKRCFNNNEISFK